MGPKMLLNKSENVAIILFQKELKSIAEQIN